jgi:hypothetical protein
MLHPTTHKLFHKLSTTFLFLRRHALLHSCCAAKSNKVIISCIENYADLSFCHLTTT